MRTLEDGLAALPGVDPDSVKVNLLTGNASCSIQGDVLDEAAITRAVGQMGYEASNVVILAQATDESDGETYQADMIISGMFCMNCVEKVRTTLASLPGTQSSTIDIQLESGRVAFQYNGNAITRHRISQTILQLGFMADSVQITKQRKDKESKQEFVNTRLTVTGMTCSSCVANIERAIHKQPGVDQCQVNLLAKSAVIRHDPTRVGARTLANMIEQLGYKAELAQNDAADNLMSQRASMRATLLKEIHTLRSRFLWSLVFAVPIVIIDMIIRMGLPMTNPAHAAFATPVTDGLTAGDIVSFCLATPVQFWLGLPFYVKSYKSLRYARTANMETLVAMGTTVAYVASVATIIANMARHRTGETMNYFETAVLLITFIHFGKWLEALAKGKTAETITKLMDLQPDRATLVTAEMRTDTESDDATLSTEPLSVKDKSETPVSTKEHEHVNEVLTEREIDAKDIQG